MAKPYEDQKPPSLETTGPAAQREEIMDEEEKILSGRDDVNMPALLTKDVKGG